MSLTCNDQSKETGSFETQMLKLAGKDFKTAIKPMLKDINIYTQDQ